MGWILMNILKASKISEKLLYYFNAFFVRMDLL